MKRTFVGEPLLQVQSAPLESGLPAAPTTFIWRNQTYQVAEVLESWKGISPDRSHGSGEMYLNKHWFKLRLTDDTIMTIYFDRHGRASQRLGSRWWLYTLG